MLRFHVAWALASFGLPIYAIELSSKFELLAYYEPISIYEFVGDWQAKDFTGGRYAWHYVSLEAGIGGKKWEYHVQLQDVAVSEFSEDTALLQMLTKNKLPLTAERYDIHLEFNRVRYYGAQFARLYRPGNDMLAKLQLSLLNGVYLSSGVLDGYVAPNSPSDYDFGNLYVDYHYSEDPIFEEPEQDTKGYGFSISAELHWRISPRLRLNGRVKNLYGMIHWPDAPYTDARIVTDTKTIDENGYAQVNPAIQGQTGTHPLNLVLPYIVTLDSRLAVTPHVFMTGSYIHTHYVAYVSSGLGLKLKNFYFSYQRTNRLVANQFKFTWNKLHLGVLFDEFSLREIKNAGLDLSLSLTL